MDCSFNGQKPGETVIGSLKANGHIHMTYPTATQSEMKNITQTQSYYTPAMHFEDFILQKRLY